MEKKKLIDNNGVLSFTGATYKDEILYQKEDIKNKRLQIKEWDYLSFINDKNGIFLTYANNTYMGLISATFMDFVKKEYITKTYMLPFTFSKMKLPSSSYDGDFVFKNKNIFISMKNRNSKREIIFNLENFILNTPLTTSFTIDELTKNNSITLVSKFKKENTFYYNRKVNLLEAKGNIEINKANFPFVGLGGLDWGRGVWPYKSAWWWSSLSTKDNEGYKGFNLGYGSFIYEDKKTSENIVFFNNKSYKLGKVEFILEKLKNGKYNYMAPWIIKDDENRVNLTFTPLLNRHDDTDFLLLASKQNQVFGYFNGSIKGDEKTTINFKNALGFMEHVINKW